MSRVNPATRSSTRATTRKRSTAMPSTPHLHVIPTSPLAETARRLHELAATESDPSLKRQLTDIAGRYDELLMHAAKQGGGGTGKL